MVCTHCFVKCFKCEVFDESFGKLILRWTDKDIRPPQLDVHLTQFRNYQRNSYVPILATWVSTLCTIADTHRRFGSTFFIFRVTTIVIDAEINWRIWSSIETGYKRTVNLPVEQTHFVPRNIHHLPGRKLIRLKTEAACSSQRPCLPAVLQNPELYHVISSHRDSLTSYETSTWSETTNNSPKLTSRNTAPTRNINMKYATWMRYKKKTVAIKPKYSI